MMHAARRQAFEDASEQFEWFAATVQPGVATVASMAASYATVIRLLQDSPELAQDIAVGSVVPAVFLARALQDTLSHPDDPQVLDAFKLVLTFACAGAGLSAAAALYLGEPAAASAIPSAMLTGWLAACGATTAMHYAAQAMAPAMDAAAGLADRAAGWWRGDAQAQAQYMPLPQAAVADAPAQRRPEEIRAAYMAQLELRIELARQQDRAADASLAGARFNQA